MKISTLFITILLMASAVMAAAWGSTYIVLKRTERDYTYLESRYAQLYSQNMAMELAGMNLSEEIWED